MKSSGGCALGCISESRGKGGFLLFGEEMRRCRSAGGREIPSGSGMFVKRYFEKRECTGCRKVMQEDCWTAERKTGVITCEDSVSVSLERVRFELINMLEAHADILWSL